MEIDARLARIARRRALTAGIGQGLATLLPALATFGCLLVGVSAVRAGHLDVVLLAVIAIVPLAAFELASPLPAATQTLSRVRGSLGRVGEVLEAEPAGRRAGAAAVAARSARATRAPRPGSPLSL